MKNEQSCTRFMNKYILIVFLNLFSSFYLYGQNQDYRYLYQQAKDSIFLDEQRKGNHFVDESIDPSIKYGLFDIKGNQILPFIYDYLKPIKGGLFIVSRYGNYGVIDAEGKDVIPRKYQGLDITESGALIVKNNNQYGLISISDSIIVRPRYAHIIELPNGYFVGLNAGSSCVFTDKGVYTIPSSENIIFPISFDRNLLSVTDAKTGCNKIVTPNNRTVLEEPACNISDLGNGYFMVKSVFLPLAESKIIDTKGTVVTSPQVKINDKSLSGLYRRFNKDGLVGIKDIFGKEIIPPLYSKIYDEKESLFRVVQESVVFEKPKYGVIDTQGKLVVDFLYDGMEDPSCNRIRVLNNKKFGYLNIDGKEIISCKYIDASDFRANRAIVGVDYNKYGLIDLSGKIIIPTEYSNIKFMNDSLLVAYTNLKSTLFDMSGKVLILPFYDIIDQVFDDKYLTVRSKGKWGVIDFNGKEILEPKYNSIDNFFDGYFVVGKKSFY